MKLAMPSAIDVLARDLTHTVAEELKPVPAIKQMDLYQKIHRIVTDYDKWREGEANHLRELLFDKALVNPQPVIFAQPSARQLRHDENQKRAEAMAALYREGKTLEEVGAAFKVTRERVRQLIKGLVSRSDGGIGYKHKLRMEKIAKSPRSIKSKMRAFLLASWDREGACKIAGIEHDPAWSDLEFCQKIYDVCGLVHIAPYLRCPNCRAFYLPTNSNRRCKPCVAAKTREWLAKPKNKLKAKKWVKQNNDKTRQYARKYYASEKGKASMARERDRKAARLEVAKLEAKQWASEQVTE